MNFFENITEQNIAGRPFMNTVYTTNQLRTSHGGYGMQTFDHFKFNNMFWLDPIANQNFRKQIKDHKWPVSNPQILIG